MTEKRITKKEQEIIIKSLLKVGIMKYSRQGIISIYNDKKMKIIWKAIKLAIRETSERYWRMKNENIK